MKATVLTPCAMVRQHSGKTKAHAVSEKMRSVRAGDADRRYCASTLPNMFSSVDPCNSRCEARAPPPPLPDGQLGFVPELVPGTRQVRPCFHGLSHLATAGLVSSYSISLVEHH